MTSVGEPEQVDAPAPPSAAIQIDDVTKSFGSVVAVDDVSLAIQPGEIVALLGPNGAGKPTTIAMILGLSDPNPRPRKGGQGGQRQRLAAGLTPCRRPSGPWMPATMA